MKKNYLPALMAGMPLMAMAQGDQQPPNIVIIIADDMGTNELGCYGGTNVKTPNIDKLADEGMRFTHNYASMAISVPLRASLYTGLYPTHHGSYRNHKATFKGTKSMTHYLSDIGYRVGRTGKDHPVNQPAIYGFEKIDGFTVGCTASHPPLAKVDGIKKFMSRDDSQPFCLVVGSIHSHAPWDAGDPSAFDPNSLTLPPNTVDNATTRRLFCNYLAEIKLLDDEVGKVMGALEETGKLDNTLVIFLAEQGPQLPFAKWTCYRYGQHSAFIARYPEKIAQGVTSEAIVQYEDILPTLIDFAGGEPIETLDGKSCLDVLYGKKEEHREWAYGMHNNLPEGPAYPIRSIQDKRYKLIWNLLPNESYSEKHMMNPENTNSVWNSWITSAKTDEFADFLTSRFMKRPEIEFYDHENDEWELENLADKPEYAERIALMKAELQKWMDEQGDTGPELDGVKEPQAVTTFEQLNAIRNDLEGNYYLENDITIPEGTEWIPIGASGQNDPDPKYFTGRIDGMGHTIRNINISAGGNFTGFIARLTNGARVKDLRLENVNINGMTPTGGLTAAMFGGITIENVSITGNICGDNEVGGIAGRNVNAELNTINNCYVDAAVTGDGAGAVYTGGLVGLVRGKALTIENCHIAGTVRAADTSRTNNYAGGLIGVINNGAADAKVKTVGCVVLADKIEGGTPNIFVSHELNTTKLTLQRCFCRDDISLTYANDSEKGSGAAKVTSTMKKPLATIITEEFFKNRLRWDFDNVWKMGDEYPVFIDQDGNATNIALLETAKNNCNILYTEKGLTIIPQNAVAINIADAGGRCYYSNKNMHAATNINLLPGIYILQTTNMGERNVRKLLIR